MNKAEEYGLKVPPIEAFDDMFRVNLYRNIGDELELDVNRLNESQIKIRKCLKEDKCLKRRRSV